MAAQLHVVSTSALMQIKLSGLVHASAKTLLLPNFDVLLTVHLSIFILVINQPDAQNLFYNKFISCLYMFRAPCAHHHQEVKIALYSLRYHHTCLFHASTCFEHHVLIIRRSKLHYTASGIITPVYFMPLHVSNTMCSSSGGQNCIIQPQVSSHLFISCL